MVLTSNLPPTICNAKVPSPAQRDALRDRPDASPVMFQSWKHLLFLHWAWDPAVLQATLPPGLFVDTFEGRAFLAVVPFWMDRVRPRFLPPVLGVSWFLELNLRTYVHTSDGTPGVWFYSLDCNHRLAVILARSLFSLPYFYARQRGDRPRWTDEAARFESQRPGGGRNTFEYSPSLTRAFAPAPCGSLEFFLAERYLLFSQRRDGRLASGRVWHRPYDLAAATAPKAQTSLFADNGFCVPERPADHAMVSSGVDVGIYPLRIFKSGFEA
ncbi:MAG: DUF2071 domain-containing protein [Verrucomicrobia bacterium]|nr:MAG: DUF2071 domain-containing protein [Verrucomicrobiota bacterium]